MRSGFDRLYLKQPEAEAVEDENGEVKHVMPPDSEWPVRDLESIDVDESIQSLKESIPLPVIFTVRPIDEGGHYQEMRTAGCPFSERPSNRA